MLPKQVAPDLATSAGCVASLIRTSRSLPSCCAMVCPQVATELATSAECVACYRGSPLLTSAGPATVKSIAGGSIR